MKVLCIGSANIDHIYKVDHFTEAGETQTCISYRSGSGGKGLNQAISVSLAGAETYFAGVIGKDGLFLKKDLMKKNVNTELVKDVDEPNGFAVIEVERSGQNRITIYQGTNNMIDCTYIDETLCSFESGDIVVLQNEINNIPYIIDRCYEKGMTIVFNAAPYSENINSYPIEKVNWLIVNEIEGVELSGEVEYDRIPEKLRGKYPEINVLLTLGKAGCRVVTKNEDISRESFEVSVVDTTGAGDTFIGYFVRGLTEKASLDETLRLASAASALAVTRSGAAESIPDFEEVMNSGLLNI